MTIGAQVGYGYMVAPAFPTSTVKAPGDTLDYLIDFTQEFGLGGGSPGDTLANILSMSVSPSGMLVSDTSIVSGGLAVVFWATSGASGQIYTVTATVMTNAGRQYVRNVTIPVGPA